MHPLWHAQLTARYQSARLAWSSSSRLRDAAKALDMDEWTYCTQYIRQFGPMYATGSTTAVRPLELADYRDAFAAAGEETTHG